MDKNNMLDKGLRDRISNLIRREVVPATGCTEPVAVALCAAHAARALGAERPTSVAVRLSGNMLKNAMGVGIPGTGMTGLPIAVSIGALFGEPDNQLEVLGGMTDENIAEARGFLDNIKISLKDDPDGTLPILYIEVEICGSEGGHAKAVISGGHTSLVYLEVNGNVSVDLRDRAACDAAVGSTACGEDPVLDMSTVWAYAMESPVEELRFILESRRMNKAIAEQAFMGNYGHCVGRTLHCTRQEAMMGDSIFSRILSYTSAASDARMAGAPIPVMSNSGSGNQGIVATIPVAVYAEEIFASEEQTIRALALSHLTVIYIKQSLGRLSALCGCVAASTGSGCGICYLMGGGYKEVVATAKNMVANLTGMICDGAKPSCALKVTSGVSTAMMSAMMAMEGHCVTSAEGIIDDDIDRTVRNLTRIGRDGMRVTDRLILDIMTSKS